jgi:uncharacterized protein YlxW (UPF0749 family)
MVDLKRNPVPSLLESLQRDHLDPGYAAAAKRKAQLPAGGPPPSSGRSRAIAIVVAACVLVGILFGVSAGSTETNAPRAEKTRSALLEDIDRAEQRQSELAATATSLAEELRATQSELGASGPLQTVAQLENASQITPVTGPGLRIVIDEAKPDPAANAPTSGGVILDRDVQLLVNDLWAAGAEAISIGGVRLQPRSAIRQAGGSILVDNRPVFWPITIEAIGDPAGMQVKSISAPGFGRFSAFAQLYGIEFDVSTQQSMNLPGGSGADLLFAKPPVTAPSAPAAATPEPTTGAANPTPTAAAIPTPTATSTG